MDLFPERAVMTNAWLTELPGKVNLPAVMHAEKFDVSFFDITQKTAPREDRLDILGQFLDRFFKRVNAVLQIILLFKKSMGSLGGANQLMHEKKVVGAAVGFSFDPEKFQAFFKLRQQSISFLEGKSFSFFPGHSSILLAG